MKRRIRVDRRSYPEIGKYFELYLVEYDHEVEDYGSGEEFRYRILEDINETDKVGGITRDILNLRIESTEDLPFKEGDIIELNPNDKINYFGTTSNRRVITKVEYITDKYYYKLKAKYPNRKIDIITTIIHLK